jgi:hypothetical protein
MIRHGSSRLVCVPSIFPFWWFSEPFLGISVGRIWGCFFEGLLLDVTYEDLVPLCLVTLIQQTLRNGFDLGMCSWGLTSDSSWLSGFWGPSFWPKVAHEVPHLPPKSHYDPWNKLGGRSLGVLSFFRGLCSSRLSRPKPAWPVSSCGLTRRVFEQASLCSSMAFFVQRWIGIWGVLGLKGVLVCHLWILYWLELQRSVTGCNTNWRTGLATREGGVNRSCWKFFSRTRPIP